jgi:hypothetical protein
MGTTGNRWTRCAACALALGLALMASACGDDDGGGEDAGTEPAGEPCMNPRATMVGCSCGPGFGEGRRRCGEDGIWEACICPPLTDAGELRCTPGQRVICSGCGREQSWDSVCNEDGEPACSCDTAPGAGDGDSMAGDAGAMASDAGL